MRIINSTDQDNLKPQTVRKSMGSIKIANCMVVVYGLIVKESNTRFYTTTER